MTQVTHMTRDSENLDVRTPHGDFPESAVTTRHASPVPIPSHRFGSPERDPVETGRRGGIRSGEVRREQAKTVRQRLREQVEAEFGRVWQAFEAGLDSDDAREKLAAAVALLAEAYGKPATTIAGDVAQPVRFIVQSAFAAHDEATDTDTSIEVAERLALTAGDES